MARTGAMAPGAPSAAAASSSRPSTCSGAASSVLARNVRMRRGEIDLIARRRRTLAFVEVKTRRMSRGRAACDGDEQQPLLGLTPRQRARLRRLAGAWLCRAAPMRARGAGDPLSTRSASWSTRTAPARLEHLEGAF